MAFDFKAALMGMATGDPQAMFKQQMMQNQFLMQMQKMKMEEEELGLRKQEASTRNKLLTMQMQKAMQEQEPFGEDIMVPETAPTSTMPNIEPGEEEGAYTTQEKPTGEINYPATLKNILTKVPRGQVKEIVEGFKGFKDLLNPKPDLKPSDYDWFTNGKGQISPVPKNQTPPPGWVPYNKPATERPVNVPNWMDALGVEMMGAEYDSVEGQKKFKQWYSDQMKTEEGKKKLEVYQSEYAKRQIPEGYTFQGFSGGAPVFQPARTPALVSGGAPASIAETGGLEPKIEPTLSVEATKEMSDWKDLYSLADDIDKLIKKSEKLVGPLTGRVRGLASKLVDDPEFVKVKTKIAKLRPVIYALSGKQINEPEQKWLYNDILPNLNNPSENFMVYLEDFKDWVKTKHNSRLNAYTDAGFRSQRFKVIEDKIEEPPPEKPEPDKLKGARLGFISVINQMKKKGKSSEEIRKQLSESVLLKSYGLTVEEFEEHLK